MSERKVSEHTILFVSVIKWVLFASIVGIAVGASSAAFITLLQKSITWSTSHPTYFFALPFALFAVILLRQYVFPKDDVETTDQVIDAIHQEKPVSLKSALKAFFLPIITIAAGGSAGKEAPCADVGSGIGAWISRRMKLDRSDLRKFMICGVSAGFASVFGTPIAGALFGVEVLFIGGILYEVLLPAMIAGIVGYHVSASLGVTYFSYPVDFTPVFDEKFLAGIVVAGIVFGLISFLFIESARGAKRLSESWKLWPPLKGLLAGFAIVGLVVLLQSADYLGLGLNTMEGALLGAQVLWYAFLLKILFTLLTLQGGGSGGLITPSLFVGATAGAGLAPLLGFDPATMAAIGMVSVLAGVANAPLSASVMAAEIFGPALTPFAAVSAVISFLMTGHRSMFPSQVLAIKKSSSIDVSTGTRIAEARPKARPKKRGALRTMEAVHRTLQKASEKPLLGRRRLEEKVVRYYQNSKQKLVELDRKLPVAPTSKRKRR